MKKIFVFIITLIIAVSSVFWVISSGTEDIRFAFSLKDTTDYGRGKAGVELFIDKKLGISSGALNICYNENDVKFIGYEIDESFPADIIKVHDNEYGLVKFIFIKSDGMIYYKGKIITLFFESKGNTRQTKITLEHTVGSLYDTDYDEAYFEKTESTVTFASPLFEAADDSLIKIDHKNLIISVMKCGMVKEDFKKCFNGEFEIEIDSDTVSTGSILHSGGNQYRIAVKGDVKGDGIIDFEDAVRLRLGFLEIISLSEYEKVSADIDCDGKITLNDYIALKLSLLKIN